METTSTTAAIESLSPSELEELHIRIATENSLNERFCLTNTDAAVQVFFSEREDPVPVYTSENTTSDDTIRSQIKRDDSEIWNSFFQSIEKGNIAALDYVINLGLDINSPHSVRKEYPIFYAIQCSKTNVMRHFINLGADVNSWSATSKLRDCGHFSSTRDMERARTPLMLAAEMGNLAVVKILCERAFADPMLVAPDGQTAQRLAARNGHKEIVMYLPAHRGGAWKRLKCTSTLLLP